MIKCMCVCEHIENVRNGQIIHRDRKREIAIQKYILKRQLNHYNICSMILCVSVFIE